MRKDSALLAEKSIKRSKAILNLISHLGNKYKTRVFLVGGPVRDLIIFKRKHLQLTQDIDIAAENHYHLIGEDLAKALNAKIIHYPQFMTLTLQLKDQSHLDIAQTRKETYLTPAILPKVRPASIEDDLSRRDFTINAMAMEITARPPYSTLDPFNGKKDLRNKLIRILHRKSFIDDPTRIFRAIRFAVRFDFTIEKETAVLMNKAIKSNCLKLLSGERILYELKMICAEKKSSEIIKAMQKLGIVKNLFGTNLPVKFYKENKLLTRLDSDKESKRAATKKLIHLFSYLPETKWSKYPLTKQTTEAARSIKEFSKVGSKLVKVQQPSEIYRILKLLPNQSLEILSRIEKKSIKDKIRQYLNKYSRVKIFTTGKTLKALNILPGKVFAKILNELLYLKLDGKIKNKNEEIEYISKKRNHELTLMNTNKLRKKKD